MSQRRAFWSWVFEKLIDYGNDKGGMGWVVYWLLGLVITIIVDAVSHSFGGCYIWIVNGYLGLTAIYLIYRGITGAYKQYLEETDNESS